MRQQELRNRAVYDLVGAPTMADAIETRPESAVPDMPKAAGLFMLMAYAGLMGAFVVTIHGARADFAMVVGTFYLMMFFAVPIAFLGVEHERTRRPNLAQFLDRGIETATGHISGGSALVQMLIVPVLLAFAILAMGITYLLV